jgi:M-phase phosphoprotein-6
LRDTRTYVRCLSVCLSVVDDDDPRVRFLSAWTHRRCTPRRKTRINKNVGRWNSGSGGEWWWWLFVEDTRTQGARESTRRDDDEYDEYDDECDAILFTLSIKPDGSNQTKLTSVCVFPRVVAQFMQRAKEKEHFNNLKEDDKAKAARAMKNAKDERPEPAIFAKNRALINKPPVRREDLLPKVKVPYYGTARVSFNGANPELEALHKELREKKKREKAMAKARKASKAKATGTSGDQDADVGDEEMAAAIAKKKRASGDFIKPPSLAASASASRKRMKSS